MARRKKRQRGKRWICPTPDCPNHARGIIGPIRPRQDDVRGYCLLCSEASGRLVKRACPSRVRQATAKAQLRATAAQRAKERKLAAAGQYPEVLRYAFNAWLSLDAWEYNLRPCAPVLQIRKARKAGTSGRAFYQDNRIALTAGVDQAWGYTILLHELAHIAVFRHEVQRGDLGHGPLWKMLYHSAAQEITGQPITVRKATIAEIDRAIAAAFQRWLDREGATDGK